jgi:hypothetical protein
MAGSLPIVILMFHTPSVNFFIISSIKVLSSEMDLESVKSSHKMGDGRIFLKISAPLSLINTNQMNLISAGSISLDSTFKMYTLETGSHLLQMLHPPSMIWKAPVV